MHRAAIMAAVSTHLGSQPCDVVTLGSVCENECVTSMCLADDGRHVLVNVSSESRPEVHLWDLEEQVIVQRFRGHRQARYVIRSCFGGARNSFVICGSEDSLVYVWHMSSGALMAKLGGQGPTHVANSKHECTIVTSNLGMYFLCVSF